MADTSRECQTLNWPVGLFDTAPLFGNARLLLGNEREFAQRLILENHYTKSIPSGKSHYIRLRDAVVVWSIPANMNIAKFLCGKQVVVWELARLWAPDNHERNLLTQAISGAVSAIIQLEKPQLLISYADPNQGHEGFVYRAASWIYDGTTDKCRVYQNQDGQHFPRRSFHSGGKGLTKKQIEDEGYKELLMPGKHRYIKFIDKKLKKIYLNAKR